MTASTVSSRPSNFRFLFRWFLSQRDSSINIQMYFYWSIDKLSNDNNDIALSSNNPAIASQSKPSEKSMRERQRDRQREGEGEDGIRWSSFLSLTNQFSETSSIAEFAGDDETFPEKRNFLHGFNFESTKKHDNECNEVSVFKPVGFKPVRFSNRFCKPWRIPLYSTGYHEEFIKRSNETTFSSAHFLDSATLQSNLHTFIVTVPTLSINQHVHN